MLDASVLLSAEDADDEHHRMAVALLESGQELATLDLSAFETANVAIRRWNDVEAAARLQERVFAIERYGLLVRVDSDLSAHATNLARHNGISVYDAGYAAAAERLSIPLASCDARDLVNRDLAKFPGDLLP